MSCVASDHSDTVVEETLPSVESMADMLTRKDGWSLIDNAMNSHKMHTPNIELFQSDDADDDIQLTSLQAKTQLEKQEALADAHVKQDEADLALSTDAQELERLKGEMSIQVIKAKSLIAAKSP